MSFQLMIILKYSPRIKFNRRAVRHINQWMWKVLPFLMFSFLSVSIILGTPSPPQNVTAKVSGPLAILLSWYPSNAVIDRYEAQCFDSDSGNIYSLILTPDTNSFTVNPLTASTFVCAQFCAPGQILNVRKGSMYRFYLRSRDSAQSYSSWVASSPVIAIDVSRPPQMVTFNAYGPLQLRASWLPPADLGGASQVLYEVWIDGGSIIATAVKDLLYVTQPWPAGSTHSCMIRAVNEAGYSDWSLSATATALLLPSPPQSVSVTVSGALSLLLQFSAPAQTGLPDQSWPISTYEILVGSSNQNEKIASVIVNGPSPQISVPFGNLTKANTYSFAVRASNAAGFGGFASLVSAMALSQAQAPFQLLVTQGLSRQIRISWQLPLDVGDYTRNPAKIFYYLVAITSSCDTSVGPLPNMSSTLLSKFQTTATSYLVSGLIPDQCITCQVTAVTLVGPGAYATQQFTPRILPLNNARVNFNSIVTGDTVRINISFIISSYIGQNDMISVQFPKNFTVDAAGLVSPYITGLDGTAYLQIGNSFVCGQECSPLSPSLLVSRIGISSAGPGTFVSFSLTGVVNRHWSGPSGSFQIKTLTMTDNIQAIDMALNISGSFLYPGTMPAMVVLGDLRAGIVTTSTVTFAPSERNIIPGSFQFLFALGAQMTFLDSVSVGSSASAPTFDGIVTYKRVGTNQILVNVVGGSNIPSGSYRSIIFFGVRNQPHSGDSGNFLVRTMTPAGDAIDENGMIPSSNIVAGVLSNVMVGISAPQSFALNTFNFTFMTGAVGLPRDAAVRIFLPFCYDTSRASLSYFQANGIYIPAQLLHSTVLSQLDLAVQGYLDLAPQTYATIILSGIRNCYANTQIQSSSRLFYVIQTFWTRDGGLSLIEQSVNIPEVDVRPAPLAATIKASSYLAGGQGNLSFSLTTTSSFVNAQSDGGQLIIAFPDGFTLTGDPAPVLTASFLTNGFQVSGDMQGSMVVSCLKQTWMQCTTLYLALLDTQSWPYGVTITLILQNIQNSPLSGYTGSFNITSASRGGRVYDQDNSLQLQLKPNFMKQATVKATPPFVGIVGPASLFIVCSNIIPPNSSIKIDFPQDYTFTPLMYVSNQSCDGTFTVSQQTSPVYVNRPNGQSAFERTGNITLFRAGGRMLPAGTPITLKLEGLKRRSTSGNTGTFRIYVLFKSIVIEEGVAPPDYFLYKPPLLLSSSPLNFYAVGGVGVTVTGLNFGVLDRNPNLINTTAKQRKRISVMGTSSLSTAWTSDTVLVSLLASGTLSTLTLAVTVESQTSTMSSVFSFQTLTVSATSTVNLPLLGIQNLITFVGRDHGPYDPSLGVRVYSANTATRWISDTSTRAIASSGFGSTYYAGISAGGLSGTATCSVSYDLPLVSDSAPTGLSLATNLYGAFIVNDLSTSARTGLSAAEQTVWMSSSAVIAYAANGFGMSHLARISIALRSGSKTQFLSYSVASVTDASIGNIATDIVSKLSLLGSGFGIFSHSHTQRTGVSNSEQTSWLSDTSIHSLVPDGSQRSQLISLTSGVEVGTMQHKLLSFNTPSISSISVSNILKEVGATVLLFAKSVGSAEISSRERLGISAAERSRWTADSTISALPSLGYSGSLSLVITTGTSVGTVSSAVSFNIPGISTSQPQNIALFNAFLVTIWSRGLGTAESSLSSSIGGTILEKSKWVSDSTLSGYCAGGLQRTKAICATVGRTTGSISSLSSYASPLLLNMSQTNIGTQQRVIFAVGSNIGNKLYSMASRSGISTSQQTFWTSDSAMNFLSSQGFQGSQTGIVTSAACVGSLSGALSYDSPRITSSAPVNFRSDPKFAIRLLGTRVGTTQNSVTHRVGGSDAEKTYWFSDSTIFGRQSNRAGSGLSLNLQLTAGLIKSTSFCTLTFDSGLSYPVSSGNIGLADDSILQVAFNVSRGRVGSTSLSLALRFGQSVASQTLWKSESSVLCKPMIGVQRSMNLLLSIGSRVSTSTSPFTFDAFSNLQISSSETKLKYRILGLNIINRTEGCGNGTVITTTPDVGFFAIVTSVDVSGSILSVYTASTGNVSDVPLSIVITPTIQSSTTVFDNCTCNSQNSMVSSPFSSCLAPVTETFSDSRINIVDSQVPGAGLPGWLASQMMLGAINSATTRFGGSACSSNMWLSSSAVQCKSLGRAIMARQFSLTVNQVVSSFSREFVYESLLLVSPDNSATKGNIMISLQGHGFGVANLCSRSRLGSTACIQSRWSSDTVLTCRSALGINSALPSVVTIQGSAVGTLSSSFSYDNPQFFTAYASNFSDTILTITGVNFGIYDASFSAMIADLGCTSTTWKSETSLACQLSAGVISSQVSSVAVKEGRLCTRCKANEVLLGCNSNSVGICQVCQGCPPGTFRMNCVPGEKYSSPGTCERCPNQDVQVGFKQFKSVFGNASTQCKRCSICGGPNQNGSQYDLVSCSEISDTICRPCKSCFPGSGVLVGCASIFEGDCVQISPNVTAIKATAVSPWSLDSLSGQFNFFTTTPVNLSFLGDFNGIKLVIPAQAYINFSKAIQNLSLSIIVPPNIMTESADGSGLIIMSEIIFCSPEGTTILPFANLTVLVLDRIRTPLRRVVNVSTSNLAVAADKIRLCLWNSAMLLWEMQSTSAMDFSKSNESLTIPISRFSTYALCTMRAGGQLPENEGSVNYLVLAIVLPLVLVSIVSVFCFWRWRVWKSTLEQKPDFSSRLMPTEGQPVPTREVEESSTTDRTFTSPHEERSPYGTLDTVGGKLKPETSINSYPRYRIEFDEENDDADGSASRLDETHSQIQEEDISVTERPPLIFSNRFAPKFEEVQLQTVKDRTRDNSAAFELYSYRADTEEQESSSDDEPLQEILPVGSGGNKADWMC